MADSFTTFLRELRKPNRAYISKNVIIVDPDGTGVDCLIKSCARCGEPFAPTERKHGYCSERCRRRDGEYRRRARLRL